ncbi:hypothetical protein X797_002441 [Metarhizium robertsii]|uniref:Uncharacterized protein n=1 Tax=Metarhizium robertsii TaxID=568076 RepID=A0A0A1V3J8_9HYPO|nr:hypothetical protein X797_002441 [Metarhizium robertsii]
MLFFVQVDLHYRQPPPTSSSGPPTGSAGPIVSLKTIFHDSLTSSITMFFNGRDEAHQMVMWPVGDNIPEKTRQHLTWVKIVKSLAVQSHTTIDLAVAPKCVAPAEICRHATSLLCSAAVGAEIALLILQLPMKWRNGASMMAEYRRLREKWLKAEGDVLPNGCEQPRVALSSEKEIAKAWATVEPCLDSFRSIIMDMTECINILSEGRTISPQLLYETIIHVRNATILFSVYEENMGTINKAMIKMETQKRRKTRLRINVALVVIFVAVTAGWFTGGLSTLVFAATGGAAAGGSAANEVSYCLDISKHKELIRQCKKIHRGRPSSSNMSLY